MFDLIATLILEGFQQIDLTVRLALLAVDSSGPILAPPRNLNDCHTASQVLIYIIHNKEAGSSKFLSSTKISSRHLRREPTTTQWRYYFPGTPAVTVSLRDCLKSKIMRTTF